MVASLSRGALIARACAISIVSTLTGVEIGTGEMQSGLTGTIAIMLAGLVTGCSSANNPFGQASSPPLSTEQVAQEDQKCQSTGYQINTPAYDYCRGELARQRAMADVSQAPPPMSAHR
jgi:hypothetical protein